MFVRAHLRDGTQVVSEFRKLKGIHKLSRQLFAGQRGFEVYEQVAAVHPASGAPAVVRRLRVYNGRDIVSLEAVVPPAGQDAAGLAADAFVPAIDIRSGTRGLHYFEAGQDNPQGATVGIAYPVEYDNEQLRRYVVVRAADEDGTGEVRHWLDPERYGYGRPSGYAAVAGEQDRYADPAEEEDDPELPGDSDDDWEDD